MCVDLVDRLVANCAGARTNPEEVPTKAYGGMIAEDFVNQGLGPGALAAVELALDSARTLSGALARAIAAADTEEDA